MSARPKSEAGNMMQEEALVEQLIDLMRRPEFGTLLVRALRGTPEFSSLFAEKLGMALCVPAFADVLAKSVVQAPAFLPALAPGQGIPPFKPLFKSDYSATPPATYTEMRAVETWSRMFNTVFDFIHASRMDGDVYEFGTYNGYTARHLALAMTANDRSTATRLHLFDTFTGFPELTSAVDKTSYEISAGWQGGGCSTEPGTADRVRQMLGMLLPSDRFSINVGGFVDTLTRDAVPRPASLIHVDCDLYESTKVVFDRMLAFDAIQDGTVLVFDDFNCARANPEFGERRAMHEAFDSNQRFSCELWFPYGWHGQVCIVHERGVSQKRGAS
jgi:predicted O-methyltransferase YrrM